MFQGTIQRQTAFSGLAALIAITSTAAIAAKDPGEKTEIKSQILEVVKQGIKDLRAFNAEKCAARHDSNLRYAGMEELFQELREGDSAARATRPPLHRVAYWKRLFKLRTFREIVRKTPQDFWLLDQAQAFTKAECEGHPHSQIRDIGKGMAADEYLIYVPTKSSLEKSVQTGEDDDDDITNLMPAIAEVYRRIDGKWLVVGVPMGELDINEDPEAVEGEGSPTAPGL